MTAETTEMQWADFGIKVPDLIAGFAGGIVNSFVFNRTNPTAVIGSMVVGALTANYLGEPASRVIGTGPGATAFIVGLAGMAICQGIVAAAKRYRPPIAEGKTDA
jgi:hypothetical protein